MQIFKNLFMRLPQNVRNNILVLRAAFSTIIKLIILDQLTKWWLIYFLKQKQGWAVKITSFLDVVYVWNYGISFGMFRNYYQYSNMAFILINIVIVAYLCYGIIHIKTALTLHGNNYIIGGAIGNLIDRWVDGAVFDFIYIHYDEYNFPVFNLADCFISYGVIVMLYDYYKIKRLKKI